MSSSRDSLEDLISEQETEIDELQNKNDFLSEENKRLNEVIKIVRSDYEELKEEQSDIDLLLDEVIGKKLNLSNTAKIAIVLGKRNG